MVLVKSPKRRSSNNYFHDYKHDYFWYAARYYYQMGDDKFVIRVGKKKLAIGNEGKKLLALYLAVGHCGNQEKIRRKVTDFPAFKIFESTFKECAIRRDISGDVISRIISQDFSELESHYLPEAIVFQTKRVADANEVNPLYWICKTSDNVNGTNFAEEFVDNINWLYCGSSFYFRAGRSGGLSEKPWKRSDIEKMVSIEKSSIFGMLFGNGTSTKRVRQETKPSQQDRKNGVVKHGKLNKEEGAESKRVAELSGNGDRVSDNSTRTEVSSYDAKLQETQKMIRQHERIISETVRDGQQRVNATMKPLNQEMVATLDELLTQLGHDPSEFRTGTAGFRPGTSDSSELGRMVDESTGDSSKSNDMGRHF